MRRSPWPGTTAGEISNVTVHDRPPRASGTVNGVACASRAAPRRSSCPAGARSRIPVQVRVALQADRERAAGAVEPPVGDVGPDHVSFGCRPVTRLTARSGVVDLVEEDAAPLVGGDDAARGRERAVGQRERRLDRSPDARITPSTPTVHGPAAARRSSARARSRRPDAAGEELVLPDGEARRVPRSRARRPRLGRARRGRPSRVWLVHALGERAERAYSGPSGDRLTTARKSSEHAERQHERVAAGHDEERSAARRGRRRRRRCRRAHGPALVDPPEREQHQRVGLARHADQRSYGITPGSTAAVARRRRRLRAAAAARRGRSRPASAISASGAR